LLASSGAGFAVPIEELDVPTPLLDEPPARRSPSQSKYKPHFGAKQRAKLARRASQPTSKAEPA